MKRSCEGAVVRQSSHRTYLGSRVTFGELAPAQRAQSGLHLQGPLPGSGAGHGPSQLASLSGFREKARDLGR